MTEDDAPKSPNIKDGDLVKVYRHYNQLKSDMKRIERLYGDLNRRLQTVEKILKIPPVTSGTDLDR